MRLEKDQKLPRPLFLIAVDVAAKQGGGVEISFFSILLSSPITPLAAAAAGSAGLYTTHLVKSFSLSASASLFSRESSRFSNGGGGGGGDVKRALLLLKL